MSEPVTEAGRSLHDSRHSADCWQAAEGCALIDLITAIEAEARTASLDEIEAKVRELADDGGDLGGYDSGWRDARGTVLARIEEVRR